MKSITAAPTMFFSGFYGREESLGFYADSPHFKSTLTILSGNVNGCWCRLLHVFEGVYWGTSRTKARGINSVSCIQQPIFLTCIHNS